jgi:spore maturation protein SpmB
MTLGHLPYYGDKQTISSNGFDRLIVAIMIYPMCFGFYVWGILTSSGILLGLKRRRKLYIIGFTLCVLNILAMLSSQFEWILD